MAALEDDKIEDILDKQDDNRNLSSSVLPLPNIASKEKKSLQSVLARLRVNHQQTSEQTTNHGKGGVISEEGHSSIQVATYTLSNERNVETISNTTSGNLDLPPKSEQESGSNIHESSRVNELLSNKISKSESPNKNSCSREQESSHAMSFIHNGAPSSTIANNISLEALTNMARSHLGVDEILRNRCNKVRSMCKGMPNNPLQWSVTHVVQFVENAGYDKYAPIFYEEEVDGHSFLLMTAHEINTMLELPVGPSLKIHDYIFTLQQLVNDAYLHKTRSVTKTEDLLAKESKHHGKANKALGNPSHYEAGLFKANSESRDQQLTGRNANSMLPNNELQRLILESKSDGKKSPLELKQESTYNDLMANSKSKISRNSSELPETMHMKNSNHHGNGHPGNEYIIQPPRDEKPTYYIKNGSPHETLQGGPNAPIRYMYPLPGYVPIMIPQVPQDQLPENVQKIGPDSSPMLDSNPEIIGRPYHSNMISEDDKIKSEPDDPVTPKTSNGINTGSEPFVGSVPVSPSHPYYDKMNKVTFQLGNAELWNEFNHMGTEMILTRVGRRMFPTIDIKVTGMHPTSKYVMILDFLPVDNYRYKYEYESSSWLIACEEMTPPPNRMYVHPESPATGNQWMKASVEFNKCKLTNNVADTNGYILMHSMHKYQPRLSVIYWDGSLPLTISPFELLRVGYRTEFIFKETQFVAVTAYQNSQMTQLKIATNPFARGFRGDWRKYPANPNLPLELQGRRIVRNSAGRRYRKYAGVLEADQSPDNVQILYPQQMSSPSGNMINDSLVTLPSKAMSTPPFFNESPVEFVSPINARQAAEIVGNFSYSDHSSAEMLSNLAIKARQQSESIINIEVDSLDKGEPRVIGSPNDLEVKMVRSSPNISSLPEPVSATLGKQYVMTDHYLEKTDSYPIRIPIPGEGLTQPGKTHIDEDGTVKMERDMNEKGDGDC